jgi:hypothetical protein
VGCDSKWGPASESAATHSRDKKPKGAAHSKKDVSTVLGKVASQIELTTMH